MILPVTLNEWLLAVLIIIFAIVGVYLILVLIRVVSLLSRVERMVSYADRVGVVLQSFEAIPTALVSVIRQLAMSFLDKGAKNKKK
jgi:hypothetical protein